MRSMPSWSSTLPRAPAVRMSAASCVVAAQDVGEGRSRQAFHEREAIEDAGVRRRRRRLDEIVDQQVDGDAERVVLVGGPVEAGAAVEVVLALGADEDVVAAFAEHLVEAAAADEDVVADDRRRD